MYYVYPIGMKRNLRDIIELDTVLIAELQAERDRTSIGPQALLKPYKDKPKGLNHAMVTHWLGGRIKTAKREHLDFVKAAWTALDTNRSIQLTDELFVELKMLQAQSGMNAEMMMRWSDANSVGLSVSKIKHYMSGNAKTIRADQLEFMKRVWSGGTKSNDGSIEDQ